MMKKFLAIAATVALMFIAACGEQDASKTDIDEPKESGRVLPEDYSAKVPDKMTIWRNTDSHPTINILCTDGIAWRTVSTSHSNGAAVARVPELDDTCPDYDATRRQFPTGGSTAVIEQEAAE
jgi:hypothetical protein